MVKAVAGWVVILVTLALLVSRYASAQPLTEVPVQGKLATPVPVSTPRQPQLQVQPASAPAGEPTSAATPRLTEHVLELTFGNAQLFFSQSLLSPDGEVRDQIIPVTAALLMAEWLMNTRVSFITLIALPLETQSTVVDGEIRQEYVAPSAAVGGRLSLFSFDIFKESVVELQLAAMAGRTLGSRRGDRFYPLAAVRLHFHTGDGFTLYLGNGYAFAEGTHSVIYGIGHRF